MGEQHNEYSEREANKSLLCKYRKLYTCYNKDGSSVRSEHDHGRDVSDDVHDGCENDIENDGIKVLRNTGTDSLAAPFYCIDNSDGILLTRPENANNIKVSVQTPDRHQDMTPHQGGCQQHIRLGDIHMGMLQTVQVEYQKSVLVNCDTKGLQEHK